MRLVVIACALTLCASSLYCTMDDQGFKEAIGLRNQGEFKTATETFERMLQQPALTPEEKRTIEFEIERIRRIRQDYTVTAEEFLVAIQKRVPGFTREEFDRFERDGKFDFMTIDGKKLYVGASVSNILYREAGLRARQTDRRGDGSLRKLYKQMQEVKQARTNTSDTLVCPQDFKVSFHLTVNKNAVPEGKTIRCWLPYVHEFAFQTSATILSTDPARRVVAPADAPHRTVYLEKPAVKDTPTVFGEQFVYRCWARGFDPEAAAVKPYRKDSELYKKFTAEKKPHIDFSSEALKKISAEAVGKETNPLLVARAIHNWISKNLIYQYAREYSTLENISDYTASRRAGDCGQHGMVFITLCRMNGIPARWQSGWESFAGKGQGMHDWTEFYVEPYGWMPADSDMALNVLRDSGQELTEPERQEVADWLFGNMDHYRLAVNSEWGEALIPPKTDFRSETVDFQRGEVECEGQNLYFDKWSCKMTIEPVSSDEAVRLGQQAGK